MYFLSLIVFKKNTHRSLDLFIFIDLFFRGSNYDKNIQVPEMEHVCGMSDLERTCPGQTRWASV